MADALFDDLGDDQVLPTAAARGPWSPDALHGGPVAALVAGAAEPLLGDLFPARVTVELLRPVPLAPLRVTAHEVRPGGKVRLVGVELRTVDGDVLVAAATALGIRRADVAVPATPAPVPAPPGPAAAPSAGADDLAVVPGGEAFHVSGVEHRFVAGTSFLEVGPAVDWIRLRLPVVAGRPTTPLQRVLAAADFGNGVSAMADFAELLFINPDLTVHLHRLPEGEWVCLDAVSAYEPHGVGLAQSALWDEHGPLGRSLQSLLLDTR